MFPVVTVRNNTAGASKLGYGKNGHVNIKEDGLTK